MIYLVEDDNSIRELVVYTLQSTGFEARGFACGADFWEGMKEDMPELVLLDIMLPDEDGLSILRKLRGAAATQKLPVMMLTAKGTEYDKVIGLDSGADDYLPKPFSMKELLARIRAMTRRQTDTTDNVLAFGDIALNRSTYQLTGPENPEGIRLAGKEYQMLEMLMSNPGQVISPDLFMDKIWGYDSEAEQNVVWVYISYLRKKITSIGSQVKIRAARGLGYSLEKDNA